MVCGSDGAGHVQPGNAGLRAAQEGHRDWIHAHESSSEVSLSWPPKYGTNYCKRDLCQNGFITYCKRDSCHSGFIPYIWSIMIWRIHKSNDLTNDESNSTKRIQLYGSTSAERLCWPQVHAANQREAGGLFQPQGPSCAYWEELGQDCRFQRDSYSGSAVVPGLQSQTVGST